MSCLTMRFPYCKILYLFLHISMDFEGQKYTDPEPLSFVENINPDMVHGRSISIKNFKMAFHS
jgi:hypothetical protein